MRPSVQQQFPEMSDPLPWPRLANCSSPVSWPGIWVRWPIGSLIRSSRAVNPAADVLDRLTVALDGLSLSLQSGQPDAVLAAEAPLAAAVSALIISDLAALAARPDARVAIMNVRLAMDRCRTLGAASAAVAAALAPTDYGARGRLLDASPLPPTVASRT
jgi:hypothetical protein